MRICLEIPDCPSLPLGFTTKNYHRNPHKSRRFTRPNFHETELSNNLYRTLKLRIKFSWARSFKIKFPRKRSFKLSCLYHRREFISAWKTPHSMMERNLKKKKKTETPLVTHTWHVSKYKVHKLHQNVPLVELCTLYLPTCQLRVTVGDSGLCCCVCVTSFKH